MPKRYMNKKHLLWVSERQCSIKSHYDRLRLMGTAPQNNPKCTNIVQVHHLLKPYFSSRGMGLKASDKDVIPLCDKSHRELHMNGNEFNFFEQKVLNSRFGMSTAKKVWDASPYNKEKK